MSFAHPTRRLRCSRLRTFLALAPALLLGIVLTGCRTGNPQTTLDPKGPYAEAINNQLFGPIFWAALAVFIIVEALLIYSIVRFRARPGDALPPQIHGNTPLEITWTIVPAIILMAILGLTFSTQAALAKPPPGGITVRVIGHQWWWEFEYSDLGFTTADEMHVPVGVPVYLNIESVDVNHSFWVPALAGKTDAIPGRVNHLWLQADHAGLYSGQCAEFCGMEHALMRLEVNADSQSDFDDWARRQRSIPASTGFGGTPVPTAQPGQTDQASLVAKGAQVFANGACITCHTVRGTQAQGKVGPDLTHFGGRTSIAARTLDNTPENLAKWLHNPPAIKPGSDMPNLGLSDDDVRALVAYLESLK